MAGGIAYATIPDGGGVIHACYQKNQGALRVIDTDKAQTCSSSENPLIWSQTGQQGQPGQQGPPGPTGPSDVWSVDGYDAGFKNLAPAQTWVNLATTSTLPAGNYSVQAEAEADSTLSISTDYSCDLVDSSTNVYQDTRATSSGDWVTIPVQAVVTLASSDTISLRCDSANCARYVGLQLEAGGDQGRDGSLMTYARHATRTSARKELSMRTSSLYIAGSRGGFPLCGSLPLLLSPAAARRSPQRARRVPRPRTQGSPASGKATTAAPFRVTSRFTGGRPARGCAGASRSRIRRELNIGGSVRDGKIKFGAVSVGAKYKGKVGGCRCPAPGRARRAAAAGAPTRPPDVSKTALEDSQGQPEEEGKPIERLPLLDRVLPCSRAM